MTTTDVPLNKRLLVSAIELAALLGIHPATVRRMHKARQLPETVAVGARGGLRKWRLAEIRDWLNSNCPPRSRWEWVPTEPQSLRRYIRSLHNEIAELERERNSIRADLDRHAPSGP